LIIYIPELLVILRQNCYECCVGEDCEAKLCLMGNDVLFDSCITDTMNKKVLAGRIFMKFDTGRFSENLLKIQVLVNSVNNILLKSS
jgi:hypothetical protein